MNCASCEDTAQGIAEQARTESRGDSEANDKYIPKRNKHDELVFPEFPLFMANLTPSQVLQMGPFGGTYFPPNYVSRDGGELSPSVQGVSKGVVQRPYEEASELKDIR